MTAGSAMADPSSEKPVDLGSYARAPGAPRAPLGAPEMVAIGLTVLWLALCLFLYLRSEAPLEGTGGLSGLLTAAGVAAPIAFVWLAALTFRAMRLLEGDLAQVHAALGALRQSHQAQQQLAMRPRHTQPPEPQAARAPAPGKSLRPQPPRAAPPSSAVPPPQATADGQTLLALDPPAEVKADPVPMAEVILALNFPDDADDTAAITALQRALQDRDLAKLIRAAQDVLTLLGQDGIYMDNLQPDRARPEVWRRFAGGERGRGIAALGGIRDRETLAGITAKMRQDPVFRDAAHHFLRSFDRSFSAFAETADDAAISALAETRTARAFMLIGRVMGTFD